MRKNLMRSLCREFVAQHSAGYDASHDISHIDRVVKNAVRILSLSDDKTKSSVSEDILVAIASLHDSFDHKYLTTPDSVMKAKAQVCEFLRLICGFSDDIVLMIIQVIDNMGFTSEVSTGQHGAAISQHTMTYLHIIQDADRLDAIGAIGMARCFAFTGAFGMAIVSADGEKERQQRFDYRNGSLKRIARKGESGVGICYDKLVFLKDMLKTPPGRELGEKRHKFMLQFFDELFDEIGE